MNKQDALSFIRQAAASDKVFITRHAEQRMMERNISRKMVYDALHLGRMSREPEPNIAKGSTECKLDHYCAGESYSVIAAIHEDNPNLIVVTVLE